MILRFPKDLSVQHILAHGAELATVMGMDRDSQGNRIRTYPATQELAVVDFPSPVLVKDAHRITQLPPTVRDTVDKLYESAVRITQYDSTSMAFEQSRWPGVWGPSIDTLLFCKGLAGIPLDAVRTSVEIGAGSGFLTQRLLEQAPGMTHAAMVDIDPMASACQRELVHDYRVVAHTNDGISFLQRGRYDLVLCNPPYIPRPNSVDDNPYEGVGLLANLLSDCASYLTPNGRLITNFSSLSEDLVLPIIEQQRLRVRTLAELEVPLKVLNVLNNAQWIGYLEARGLERRLRNGYEYWQGLRIVEVTPPR